MNNTVRYEECMNTVNADKHLSPDMRRHDVSLLYWQIGSLKSRDARDDNYRISPN